ncbi:MAG TPA: hypothetical protein VMV29_02150 [Ktedonobacterales bacterium]|nr:hypothetical protein [Ktedonobacterales bacterium]
MERRTRWIAPPHAPRYARGSLLWWLSLLLSTAIVIGVVGTLLAGGRLVSGRRGANAANAGDLHSRIVISTLASAGLRSPSGAAFSPDSASLAVIGSRAACGSQQTQGQTCGHALAIFASATGNVARVIPLERLLGLDGMAAIAQGGGERAQLTADDVRFFGLGWSPDGSRVALVFTVFSGQAPFATEVYSGLLVVDVVHATGVVIPGDSDYFAGLDATDPTTPVWNLAQQDAYSIASPAPGLAYGWSSAGFPTTTIPLANGASQLPPQVGPGRPVGIPDRDATFSAWQPGMVIGPGSVGLSGDQSAFVSSFPSWSPDGAHAALLTTGVALNAPAHGLGTGAAGVSAAETAPDTPLPPSLLSAPPRDAALIAVQQEVGRYGWALVAWNPSGTTLASVNCFDANGQSLTLRDTASGATFGTTSLGLNTQPAQGQRDLGCQTTGDGSNSAYPTPNLTLGWAPDGAQVVVADRAAATLTLWSVG